MLDKIYKKATANPKAVAVLIISLIVSIFALCAAGYYAWHKHSDTTEKLELAKVLSQQQATDVNVLRNKLDMSKQNAEMLANFIKKAQVGQVQPINYFTVQAPSPQEAVQQVTDRINQRDPTLPPAILQKTDRTVVSSAFTTPEQKLAIDKQNTKNGTNINDAYLTNVYKVNMYRNWEISAGVGQHGGDRYIPIELQRNFSKDAAVSVEYHIGGKDNGWEVKCTRKIDKLFLVF